MQFYQFIKRLILPLPLALVLMASEECLAAGVPVADTLRTDAGISLRTNLLWDALAEPNLGFEVPVGDHVTLGANAGIKTWPRWLAWDNDDKNTTHWRNFAVVPEARYYFDQIYQGWFAGTDFVYTHFNVGNVTTPFHMYPEAENYRVQGSYWAGGLFAGYAWWPWQHWRLELEAGLAAGLAAYERFDCPHCGTKLADERKMALVPKLGLNVAYNPVARDKRPVKQASVVYSGTDTLTVLTPPVAFVVQLKDVQAPATAGDKLSAEEPWILPISQYRPMQYSTQTAKDSLLYVQFPVGGDVLKPEVGQNAQVLDRVQRAVEILRKDPRTSELLVSVVGMSSIEGQPVQNDTLSVRRARALARELQARTGIERRYFEIIGKGEAWDWFREQVNEKPEGFTEAELQKLQSILDSPLDAEARKRQLRADVALYAKVSQLLLASQRNAGYIRVYYGTEEDAATGKFNSEIAGLLKARRYHDTVRAVQADAGMMDLVRRNPEAMNAYGIALYFTALDGQDAAREKEAVGLIREAAAQGSEAAAQNLKGIEVYGPARKEYEAWRKIMK